MRFLRSTAVYTSLDHKLNEDIQQVLRIFNINRKTMEYSRKGFEHITRMSNIRVPKSIMAHQPVHTRHVERPNLDGHISALR